MFFAMHLHNILAMSANTYVAFFAATCNASRFS
ncbi:hypothetical protein RAZWK3B_12619 [Roseobacter sp. AzwK-3b]|nr:hypothetical protein RAZWK3B_12619 [Roseobacter sp. AzwK-3b]